VTAKIIMPPSHIRNVESFKFLVKFRLHVNRSEAWLVLSQTSFHEPRITKEHDFSQMRISYLSITNSPLGFRYPYPTSLNSKAPKNISKECQPKEQKRIRRKKQRQFSGPGLPWNRFSPQCLAVIECYFIQATFRFDQVPTSRYGLAHYLSPIVYQKNAYLNI
jgi:hypothetical protein